MGWIGPLAAVRAYVKDRVKESFSLLGPEPVLGMGEDEVIINDATIAVIDGEPVALAEAMIATGSGIAVQVF